MHDRSPLTRRGFLTAGAAAAAGFALHSASAAADEADAWPIAANYYRHFDADYEKDTPEEGFGGWKKETLTFSRRHTALAVMHAWDAGTREQFPGWYRAVPYIPRANAILREVFPRLLGDARAAGMPIFHVTGSGDFYKKLPGHLRTLKLAGPEPPSPDRIACDPIRNRLDAFRNENVFPGKQNVPDIDKGFARLDFPPEARPLDSEDIAENGRQLFALCKDREINHLVYAGFAVNWCLLVSPGGMAEMGYQHGLLCSVIRQATTAVENRESAKAQWAKELGLWRVALAFGFVFDFEDFDAALRARSRA